MPPKPRFTREKIIATALSVVSRDGINALTAKSLGNALNTSATPIFTVFNSMQEVVEGVKTAAMERFETYAHKTDANMPIFKQVGMQMILFAKEEPQLYQLIFMSQNSDVKSFTDIYHLGVVADECLNTIQNDYVLSGENAKMLFEHSWIHTYGIATLCATGMCNFTQEEISRMLTQDFTAMMLQLKRGAVKMKIETERLILRPYREEDLQDLYEYLSNEEVVRFEPYLPMDISSARENLAWRISTNEMIAVELKESGKMIGNVYLGQRDFDTLEIGYVFSRSFWGHGYATEACRMVIERAFSDGVHRIYAEVDPENVASWRLLERLGMRKEAHLRQNVYFWRDTQGEPIWKDTYVYAILGGEYLGR